MDSAPAPEVSTSDLADALANGAQLIDVREPDEFASGHVPNARPIPLGVVLENYDSLDKHRPVYVICAAGVRSMAAAGALRQVGIDAQSVAGGTNAWIGEDRPISTDSSSDNS